MQVSITILFFGARQSTLSLPQKFSARTALLLLLLLNTDDGHCFSDSYSLSYTPRLTSTELVFLFFLNTVNRKNRCIIKALLPVWICTHDSGTTFKVKRSKLKVTRPLYLPLCCRIRQLQRWAWERVDRA